MPLLVVGAVLAGLSIGIWLRDRRRPPPVDPGELDDQVHQWASASDDAAAAAAHIRRGAFMGRSTTAGYLLAGQSRGQDPDAFGQDPSVIRRQHPVVYVVAFAVFFSLIYWVAAMGRDRREARFAEARTAPVLASVKGELVTDSEGALRFHAPSAGMHRVVLVTSAGRPNDVDGFVVTLPDGSEGSVSDLTDGDVVELGFTGLCPGEPTAMRSPMACDVASIGILDDQAGR